MCALFLPHFYFCHAVYFRTFPLFTYICFFLSLSLLISCFSFCQTFLHRLLFPLIFSFTLISFSAFLRQSWCVNGGEMLKLRLWYPADAHTACCTHQPYMHNHTCNAEARTPTELKRRRNIQRSDALWRSQQFDVCVRRSNIKSRWCYVLACLKTHCALFVTENNSLFKWSATLRSGCSGWKREFFGGPFQEGGLSLQIKFDFSLTLR